MSQDHHLSMWGVVSKITVLLMMVGGGCLAGDKGGSQDIPWQESQLAADQLSAVRQQLIKLDPQQAQVALLAFTSAPLEGELAGAASPVIHGSDIGAEVPAQSSLQEASPPVAPNHPLRRTVEFPYLEVQFDGANFVKVLRCPAAYRHSYDAFVSTASYEDPFGDMRYEAFWLQAAQFSVSGCVYMGTHVVREQIFDLAAPTGHWFYLLNPCVSQGFSLSTKEECSHRLVASAELDFVSIAHENVRNDAHEVDAFEAQALALRDAMLNSTQQIAAELKYCEKSAAIAAHNAAVDNAWRASAGAVIGGVVGFVLAPMLGPMGLQAVRHGIQLGSAMFSDGKQAMERYIDQLKCSKAQGFLDEFNQHQQAIARLTLAVKRLRDRLAAHDARLALQHQELQHYYTNMADCQCIPPP